MGTPRVCNASSFATSYGCCLVMSFYSTARKQLKGKVSSTPLPQPTSFCSTSDMAHPSGSEIVSAIVEAGETPQATSQGNSASTVPPPPEPVAHSLPVSRRRCWAECGPPVPTGDLMRVGNSNSWRYFCSPCNNGRRAIDASLIQYLERLVLR